METFSALLAPCEGSSSFAGEFPSQRSVTRSFDVFFYLNLSKRLSKPSRRRWFERSSLSLWRHCDELYLPLCSQLEETPASLPTTCLQGMVHGLYPVISRIRDLCTYNIRHWWNTMLKYMKIECHGQMKQLKLRVDVAVRTLASMAQIFRANLLSVK